MASNALEIIGPVRGRPTKYDDALAAQICERLAGGDTLVTICADAEMPSESTVYRWRNLNEEFSRDYARAREAQMDLEADQIREIADKPDIEADHKRVMVDARKWRAERLNRRAYGQKVEHDITTHQHPAHGAEGLPAGLGWLAGQLPGPQSSAGPGPGDSGMGEE